MIWRWAVVWTGSPDLAEDVAQGVLMRVDGSLASYVDDGHVITWVYRITKNALIDGDRSRSREDTLRDRLRLEEVAGEVAVDGGSRCFEAVDLLKHIMAVLSPQQRAVLDLVHLQGFSAREAADMLEIAPATIRVHLHRAREVVRARVLVEESVGEAHG